MFDHGGIIGFLILVLDIWAIVNIVTSGDSTGAKVLWTVLVVVLPVLGFLIWLFAVSYTHLTLPTKRIV